MNHRTEKEWQARLNTLRERADAAFSFADACEAKYGAGSAAFEKANRLAWEASDAHAAAVNEWAARFRPILDD